VEGNALVGRLGGGENCPEIGVGGGAGGVEPDTPSGGSMLGIAGGVGKGGLVENGGGE
jgi:hypothetical protein